MKTYTPFNPPPATGIFRVRAAGYTTTQLRLFGCLAIGWVNRRPTCKPRNFYAGVIRSYGARSVALRLFNFMVQVRLRQR